MSSDRDLVVQLSGLNLNLTVVRGAERVIVQVFVSDPVTGEQTSAQLSLPLSASSDSSLPASPAPTPEPSVPPPSAVPPLPQEALLEVSRLRAITGHSPQQRVERAWELGFYDRSAVAASDEAERDIYQRGADPLPLANSYFVILRCPGTTVDCPCLVQSKSLYHSLVRPGNQFRRGSVSRGFPTKTEARVYCLGVGLDGLPRLHQ
jgi:hypothetical protein